MNEKFDVAQNLTSSSVQQNRSITKLTHANHTEPSWHATKTTKMIVLLGAAPCKQVTTVENDDIMVKLRQTWRTKSSCRHNSVKCSFVRLRLTLTAKDLEQ